MAPAFERHGERLDIIVGTSIGALNGSFLAATAHLPLTDALRQAVGSWRELRFRDVLGPLLSARELSRVLRYVGEVAGLRGASVPGILDTSPMAATLRRIISFDQLARNVDDGALRSAAVVATSYESTRSVVFHHGGAAPPPDEARQIDYLATPLSDAHVLASAAIPALFPAVRVGVPAGGAGWYGDGGTRLNTPLKPALALGAERVVVIGLNSGATPAGSVPGRPDALDGAALLLQTVLADQLAGDVATLASINETVGAKSGKDAGRHRRIPYIFVAPADRFAVGRLAVEVYRRHYASLRDLLRARDVALLGRLVDGGRSQVNGELLSYLFFAPELVERLIALGREDGERWLATRHDDGIWQLGRLRAQ